MEKMIYVSDISKDFILNKAVRDATNILLKPYMPIVLTESCSTPNNCDNHEAINNIKVKWISHTQDFLLKMTTIAWDFLNILNMFQNNLENHTIEDISNNSI